MKFLEAPLCAVMLKLMGFGLKLVDDAAMKAKPMPSGGGNDAPIVVDVERQLAEVVAAVVADGSREAGL